MSERLPIEKSELEKPNEIFDAIAAIRTVAQAQRAAYRESVAEMGEQCVKLRGVELFITGRLEGRGGTRVYPSDPLSQVERLHVRVGSAKVETYEGGGRIAHNLPYISITAWSVEANELLSANLGVGELGVSAEIIESSPVQA